MSFFLGSWDMNRSAEQTNRTRTASRFTRFVCSALRFISHEPRKKDTHSLNKDNKTNRNCRNKMKIYSELIGSKNDNIQVLLSEIQEFPSTS